eukprot:1104282-Rhodomonas_salina.1
MSDLEFQCKKSGRSFSRHARNSGRETEVSRTGPLPFSKNRDHISQFSASGLRFQVRPQPRLRCCRTGQASSQPSDLPHSLPPPTFEFHVRARVHLSLIHISEPTRPRLI